MKNRKKKNHISNTEVSNGRPSKKYFSPIAVLYKEYTSKEGTNPKTVIIEKRRTNEKYF
jgi:hypothetical protein